LPKEKQKIITRA